VVGKGDLMSNTQLSDEAIERVFNEMMQRAAPQWKSVFDHVYRDRNDKSITELVGELRASFPPGMWADDDLLRFAETIASGTEISPGPE
jgi:hypothetical protein